MIMHDDACTYTLILVHLLFGISFYVTVSARKLTYAMTCSHVHMLTGLHAIMITCLHLHMLCVLFPWYSCHLSKMSLTLVYHTHTLALNSHQLSLSFGLDHSPNAGMD